MNDTPNRGMPASQLTKREEAALRIYTSTDASIAAAVRAADELFDELDGVPKDARGLPYGRSHSDLWADPA